MPGGRRDRGPLDWPLARDGEADQGQAPPESGGVHPETEGVHPASDEADAGSDSDPRAATAARVEWLDPRDIVWPEGRVSSEYDAGRAEALRQSMEALGQQDAVGVIELEDGTLEGAAGMNRCQAAIEGGLGTVLCVVRRGSHRDVVTANLATAINQSRPNPLSEVEGIAHAHYEEGIEVAELAGITGRSVQWIEDRLRVNDASPAVKQYLGDRTIAIGHAVALAGLEDHALQEDLLLQLQSFGWTVAQLEEQIRVALGLADGDGNGDGEENVQVLPAGEPPEAAPPRARSLPACSHCGAEADVAEIQTVSVCVGCSGLVGPNPLAVGQGEVAVPMALLRQAEELLAGNQAGAQLAMRLAELIEEREQALALGAAQESGEKSTEE